MKQIKQEKCRYVFFNNKKCLYTATVRASCIQALMEYCIALEHTAKCIGNTAQHIL